MKSLFSEQTLTCVRESWSPGIGDPDVMGWVTVGIYMLTALSSLTLAGRIPADRPYAMRERLFWGVIGVILTFLAVNKQLDLQSAMTALGRCLAQLQGWYDERQAVQRRFIQALALGAVTVAIFSAWFLRHSLRRNGLAVLGFAFLLGFVVIRAVGFHDVDQLIGARLQSVRVNWVLELTGLVLILLNALPRLLSGRK
jgi:hypothetical protein